MNRKFFEDFAKILRQGHKRKEKEEEKMERWQKISDEVCGAMPTTELKGFICDVDVDSIGEMTEEEREVSEERFFREIDKMLPEYATYVPESSSIRLPIDKVDGFEVDWESILAEAYRRISE